MTTSCPLGRSSLGPCGSGRQRDEVLGKAARGFGTNESSGSSICILPAATHLDLLVYFAFVLDFSRFVTSFLPSLPPSSIKSQQYFTPANSFKVHKSSREGWAAQENPRSSESLAGRIRAGDLPQPLQIGLT